MSILKFFKSEYFILILIFCFAFLIRFLSVYPTNTIIGFDQSRDLFAAKTILENHDLKIIGPTAGNNPNLHHGIGFTYYLAFPMFLFGPNPINLVLFNSLINSLTVIILYFFALSLFNSKKIAFASSLIAACSYQLVQYSGWLSNPTVTIFTVPTFFYLFWLYIKGQPKAFPLAAFFLGLCIQFQLFFVYLLPISLLIFLIFKPKLPSLKLSLVSILLFCLATSTMILTELKFRFAGVFSLLGAGDLVGEKLNFVQKISRFSIEFFQTFNLNLGSQNIQIGQILALMSLGLIIFQLLQTPKKTNSPYLYLLIFLLSPSIMLFLGFHNSPWFLIGLPSAVILAIALLISRLRLFIFYPLVLILIILANIVLVDKSVGRGQVLLEPDPASVLTDQIAAINYTYASSDKATFTINSLTNPLYINLPWAYHYLWYGQPNFNYLPTWAGGDQLPPYNTLAKVTGQEKYLYLLIDSSSRIPPSHKLALLNWANERSILLEQKTFNGIEVQKRLLFRNMAF